MNRYIKVIPIDLEVKIRWKKSVFSSLNWLLPHAFVKCIEVQSLTHVGEEYNKYDKTTTPHFLLVNNNDWSRCFVITYLRPICSPNVSLLAGLAKKTKLEYEEYFYKVTYLALLEML
jgi:hypothetical protein